MRRAPACIVLFGIVSTVGAWLSLDLLYACLAALATITYAAFAPSIVGSTPIHPGSAPDPAQVRSWRETHPDSTVSEAIDAVTKRERIDSEARGDNSSGRPARRR
jgi:hypothetical protein